MERIGFVGLGVMGGLMAGHLRKAGADLTVWNRTREKEQPLLDQGAHRAENLAQLGRDCSLIFLCVSRTEDVQACLDQLTQEAAPGALFVDHSTISPVAAKQMHADLTARGFRFLDAPITGGSMGAQAGALTIFCGGSEADFERAAPWLDAYAKRAQLVGEGGAGQMMKMANQIAVGGALLGLCESLAFAEKAGLDVALTREMLAGGAAGSWAFDNYGPKILNRDWSPGFSIENQRKDFGYCSEAAKDIGAMIPMTDLADALLKRLEEAGHGGWTTAALYEAYLEPKTER